SDVCSSDLTSRRTSHGGPSDHLQVRGEVRPHPIRPQHPPHHPRPHPRGGQVRILDLFAGSGGAGRGYELAGFDVYSVDLDHQALVHNPHATTTRDALAVMRELLRGERVTFWRAGVEQ